jgi:hypothetical protein
VGVEGVLDSHVDSVSWNEGAEVQSACEVLVDTDSAAECLRYARLVDSSLEHVEVIDTQWSRQGSVSLIGGRDVRGGSAVAIEN